MPTATHHSFWTRRRRLAVVGGLLLALAVAVTPIQWYAGYRAVRRVRSNASVRPPVRRRGVEADDPARA
ncbi:hypothetical protein [Salinirubrum litoreum]|uniref:Uncharacterized protein n=1 Tax=Salinirubrum litoreum TaxID=1126234 RepID=A0ABD5RCF6_9EURY|nr:hypothetical protein [Salinirubrum litoreum]